METKYKILIALNIFLFGLLLLLNQYDKISHPLIVEITTKPAEVLSIIVP